MNCPRCGGLLVDDEYNRGKRKCLMCGRWPEKAQSFAAMRREDDKVELSEECRLRELWGLSE